MTHSEDVPESIVVIGPDGRPLTVPADADSASAFTAQVVPDDEKAASESAETLTDMVEQPAKVMRIGTMIKQLLEEVRAAPLDDASRSRLKEIHKSSVRELEQGLAPELREELERLTLPFTDDSVPSDAELRIAQAQLVGWLEGLFHGIQTALFAQQMAARALAHLLELGALPPGMHAADAKASGHVGGGQYL
jgi:hypothetical protein